MSTATDVEGNEIGKLFVGGLAQATNQESIHNYFSNFGEVDEAVVMMDHRTGRSRGFGYVKFKKNHSVDIVMDSKPHILDGKEIDAKQCNVHMRGKNRRSLKVFVGGISAEHDANTIRQSFEKYGTVTDVNLMMDHTKQRHRGFAFVGFHEEGAVKQLIQLHYVSVCGKEVEIKAMEPPNYDKKNDISLQRPSSPCQSMTSLRPSCSSAVESPSLLSPCAYPCRNMQGMSSAVPQQMASPWNMTYTVWPQMTPGVHWQQWPVNSATPGVPMQGACDYSQQWMTNWAYNNVATAGGNQQTWCPSAAVASSPNTWQPCLPDGNWGMTSLSNVLPSPQSPIASNSVNPNIPLLENISNVTPLSGGGVNGAGTGQPTVLFMNPQESTNSFWESHPSIQGPSTATLSSCWTPPDHSKHGNGPSNMIPCSSLMQLVPQGCGSGTPGPSGTDEYEDQQGFVVANSTCEPATPLQEHHSGSNSNDIYSWIYSGMKDIKYYPLHPSENPQASEIQTPDGAAGDYSRPTSSLTPYNPTQMYLLPPR